MIRDSERREVAAKLREKKKDFFGVRSFFPQDIILYRSLYMQAIDECLPDGDCCFDVLADLIDRPMTHIDVNKHGRACCANCGCDDWCLADDNAHFCPQCGAEVVNDD